MIGTGPINRLERYSVKVLDVYMAKYCFGDDEALILARDIEENLPDLQVRVTVLGDEEEDQKTEKATMNYLGLQVLERRRPGLRWISILD